MYIALCADRKVASINRSPVKVTNRKSIWMEKP
jgi:hypothetical protein